MPISLVQTGTATNSSSTVTLTWPSSLTSGNLVVVALGQDANHAIVSSMSDNLGNTYGSILNAGGSGPETVALWYAKNITGGVGTITITNTGIQTTNVIAREYSGIDTSSPLDGTATAGVGTFNSSINTGTTAVTSQGSELAIAACQINTAATIGYDANYINGTFLAQVGRMAYEERILSSTGAQFGTFILGANNNWDAGIATFKAAGAAAPAVHNTFKSLLGVGNI